MMTSINDLRQIAGDVADLCELQVQLLAIDGKAAASKATASFVGLVLASAVMLASCTTLMVAGGWALHEFCLWPLSVGLATSALVGMALAMAMTVFAYRSSKNAVASLGETRNEFATNLRWFKSLLAKDTDSHDARESASYRQEEQFYRPQYDRAP